MLPDCAGHLIPPGAWVLEGLSSALSWYRAWPGQGWLRASKVAPALQCDQFFFLVIGSDWLEFRIN